MALPRDDQPVTYPSVLTTLAKDHEGNWRQAAHAEVVRATGTPVERSSFGGAPAAQAFGAVYAAAATEYTATLRGIQDDLVTVAQNLALAAEEMRSRDENAGDAFVALLARWTNPSGFESNRQQEQAKDTEEVVEGSATLGQLDQPGSGDAGSADGGSEQANGLMTDRATDADPADDDTGASPVMETAPTAAGPGA